MTDEQNQLEEQIQLEQQAQTDTAAKMPPVPVKLPLSLLICKSGQIIARPTQDITSKLIVPLNISGDARLFLKLGQIVRPYIKVEFTHQQTLDIAGMTVALYEETATSEFDPTGLEPIQVESLDTVFNELNQQA